MNVEQLKPVVEAILMVADEPLSLDRLAKLTADEGEQKNTNREVLRHALTALQGDYAERGIELAELASGYRFRTRARYAEVVGRLWEERKPRYSRAFMETLAIIAYRQPITRGEIEHIRGVAVSTNIMRQLLEREWVRVVGHRDVPGRPSVYATTDELLDYFGLKSLEELPSLAELKDIDDLNSDLFAEVVTSDGSGEGEADGAQAESLGEVTEGDDGQAVDGAAADVTEFEQTAEIEPIEALEATGDMDELNELEVADDTSSAEAVPPDAADNNAATG